jgi:hypothetical protein
MYTRIIEPLNWLQYKLLRLSLIAPTMIAITTKTLIPKVPASSLELDPGSIAETK